MNKGCTHFIYLSMKPSNIPLYILFLVLPLISLFTTVLPGASKAALDVPIEKGNVAPLSIALPYFGVEKSSDSRLARDIIEVVEADLESSGLFRSIDRKAFIQKVDSVEAVPQFPDWRQINAQALVTGTVRDIGDGEIRAEFRLWDILSQKQVMGKTFSGSREGWRRVAHLVADQIYSRLTGEGGYFDTRIVYISESGERKRPVKRLAIMDQDGANHQFLTSGQNLVLTPRFDPASQRIIYMAYYNKKPRVYLYNLRSGKEELLGSFDGMSFAPRFSPDGSKAVMSVSVAGNSEIYEMDLNSRRKKRLTSDPAIDTSPSYSPDGKQVVFNSDRGGSQQIYVMDSDGDDVKRISFGKGSYATPVWSPRGDLIAFTRIYRGKFYIGVMRPDGSGERLLTESYLDEGPTWAPNGRRIMFTRQDAGGTPAVYSIDLTGYNERRTPTPGDASDPAWSPLLSK